MWMTRKRTHELVYSLSSFIMNADDNSNIEYIIVLDPDDSETIDALKKISNMCCVHDVELIYHVVDKRYGYEELEGYQNAVGKFFKGECLIIMNDDVVCLNKSWDTEIRNSLEPVKNTPSWIGLSGINEGWKGSITFVGVNRKWYDVVGTITGNRATDGYITDLGREAGIEPLRPNLEMVHLQRGSSDIEYQRNGKKYIVNGLPDDGMGGYPTKNPKPPKYYHKIFKEKVVGKTDFVEGVRRFDYALSKLKEFLS